jgi:hypothetical protein
MFEQGTRQYEIILRNRCSSEKHAPLGIKSNWEAIKYRSILSAKKKQTESVTAPDGRVFTREAHTT